MISGRESKFACDVLNCRKSIKYRKAWVLYIVGARKGFSNLIGRLYELFNDQRVLSLDTTYSTFLSRVRIFCKFRINSFVKT